jgi:DUF438 domain-containing protein
MDVARTAPLFIAVRDEKGNYLGIALVRYDVTEREQLRAQLESGSTDKVY